MKKQELIIIVDSSQTESFALGELCEICDVSPQVIKMMIDYEIIQPQGGGSPETWTFDLSHLQRIKQALRLKRGLEVNFAGVALILELLDELETLRTKMDFLEKHFGL